MMRTREAAVIETIVTPTKFLNLSSTISPRNSESSWHPVSLYRRAGYKSRHDDVRPAPPLNLCFSDTSRTDTDFTVYANLLYPFI